jgi:hypothetical protein
MAIKKQRKKEGGKKAIVRSCRDGKVKFRSQTEHVIRGDNRPRPQGKSPGSGQPDPASPQATTAGARIRLRRTRPIVREIAGMGSADSGAAHPCPNFAAGLRHSFSSANMPRHLCRAEDPAPAAASRLGIKMPMPRASSYKQSAFSLSPRLMIFRSALLNELDGNFPSSSGFVATRAPYSLSRISTPSMIWPGRSRAVRPAHSSSPNNSLKIRGSSRGPLQSGYGARVASTQEGVLPSRCAAGRSWSALPSKTNLANFLASQSAE